MVERIGEQRVLFGELPAAHIREHIDFFHFLPYLLLNHTKRTYGKLQKHCQRGHSMRIIKPPRLQKGNVIGLIAPASPASTEEKITGGIEYLERLGYHVKVGAHIRNQHGFLAGTDEERAEDFNAMVRDPQVHAIFALRGGYGTPRLLRLVDYRAITKNPKIIAGYSDITALQLAMFRKTGLITFSGPMPGSDMWKELDPFTEEHFWRVLTSSKKIGVLKNPDDEPLSVLHHGSGQGRLLGGNFALLTSLIGTPYLPSLRHSVLVLEDVEEAPHRVDRMLAQLLNAGILDHLAGLVFGKFTDCHPANSNEPFLSIDQVQKEYAVKVGRAVLANFQYGHIPRKLTLPLGLPVSIQTKPLKINILEHAVE